MELTFTLTDIDDVAQKIINYSTGKTLLFYGGMGAGKTTLIKAIVKQLGIPAATGSPTFALVHEYGNENKVYHFDFYRIKDETEAYDIGFEDYVMTDAWICIEWPEKIAGLIPDKHTAIQLTAEKNNIRSLIVKNIG